MLDIWTHLTELSYRGFGKKKRKMPKEPRNFSQWSEDARNKWRMKEEEKLKWLEWCDVQFVKRESDVIDDLCRNIIYLIDGANELRPQRVFECDKMRDMQDDAIIKCCNLKRELNHIMATIPSNKNFITMVQNDIDTELRLLRGWKKKGNETRKEVLAKEAEETMNINRLIYGESVR